MGKSHSVSFVPRLPTTKCIYGDVHERKRVNETHFAALTIASVEKQVAPPPGGSSTQHGRGAIRPMGSMANSVIPNISSVSF